MLNKTEDKSVKKEMTENKENAIIKTEQEYFFPTHQITIKAVSKEEAEKKLNLLIDKDKKI